jgi:hypothetical protein
VAVGICLSVFALRRDSTCISLVGAHLMSRVLLSGVGVLVSADTVLVDPASVTISLYMQGWQSIGVHLVKRVSSGGLGGGGRATR